jgi:gluconolactonase
MKKLILPLITILGLSTTVNAQYKTIGKIHVYDESVNTLIDPSTLIEIIAEGYTWSEGPVWVKKGGYLLFSDVPENKIYQWTADKGAVLYLTPSGYSGKEYYSYEPGTNGLIINQKGNLVSAEHGDRRIAEMPLGKPESKKSLTGLWEGKKLNSPNDVIQAKNGDYYFTDPPYGLPGRGKEEVAKEIAFQGVYRISKKGELSLQYDKMARPNGLAMNLDESILYVGSSEPKESHILAFPVDKKGNLGEPTVFFDAAELAKQGIRGGYDGMKLDSKGNIWTTGPGGILIISPAGKLLGRIETGNPNSNVNFGEDGSTLFITSKMNLLRVKTKTKGLK